MCHRLVLAAWTIKRCVKLPTKKSHRHCGEQVPANNENSAIMLSQILFNVLQRRDRFVEHKRPARQSVTLMLEPVDATGVEPTAELFFAPQTDRDDVSQRADVFTTGIWKLFGHRCTEQNALCELLILVIFDVKARHAPDRITGKASSINFANCRVSPAGSRSRH